MLPMNIYKRMVNSSSASALTWQTPRLQQDSSFLLGPSLHTYPSNPVAEPSAFDLQNKSFSFAHFSIDVYSCATEIGCNRSCHNTVAVRAFSGAVVACCLDPWCVPSPVTCDMIPWWSFSPLCTCWSDGRQRQLWVALSQCWHISSQWLLWTYWQRLLVWPYVWDILLTLNMKHYLELWLV